MIISIIVAVSQNDVIGSENKLPWHLPADLKHFKQLTMGHHMIMGRSTYESIGRPLPGRTSIIVTRQNDYRAEGCRIAPDLPSAFEMARQNHETECFVIGGADVIRQSLVWADRIYLTRIYHDFEGDTFLPGLSEDDWVIVKDERHAPDEKNGYGYAFQLYEVKRTGS